MSLMDPDNLISDYASKTTFSVSSADSNTKKIAVKKKFPCPKCKMSFAWEYYFKRHISKVHALEDNNVVLATPEPKTYKYKCEHCKRQFNRRAHYNFHKRKAHPESITEGEFVKISCPECHGNFQKKDIFSHYEQDHDVKFTIETLQFQTIEEFNAWKDDISVASSSKFVLQRTKKISNVSHYYFKCHRSGFFKSKGKGLRRLKTKGSTKIDSLCPSKMKVTQDVDGKCEVEYQSTHFGHQIDLNHLPLTRGERQTIIEKIEAELPLDIILEEVKKSVSNSNVSRLHRLTRKDVHNIAASYHKKCRKGDNGKKLTSKLNEIQKRHELSLNFQAEIIKHDEVWVLKALDMNEFCTVKENVLECLCELICATCNVCVHKYSCSCVDSSINFNMCKHIHFFCQYKDRENCDITYVLVDLVQQEIQCNGNEYEQEVFLNELNNESNNIESCLDIRKRNLIDSYSKLIDSLSSTEELDLMEKHLDLLKSTLAAAKITQNCQ